MGAWACSIIFAQSSIGLFIGVVLKRVIIFSILNIIKNKNEKMI